jgi:hypothetical protein
MNEMIVNRQGTKDAKREKLKRWLCRLTQKVVKYAAQKGSLSYYLGELGDMAVHPSPINAWTNRKNRKLWEGEYFCNLKNVATKATNATFQSYQIHILLIPWRFRCHPCPTCGQKGRLGDSPPPPLKNIGKTGKTGKIGN